MLIAWMTFEQADGWGKFNTGSMAEVLRKAGRGRITSGTRSG